MLNPRCPAAVAKSTEAFKLQISSDETPKLTIPWTVFLTRIDEIKVYTYKKSRFSVFLHNLGNCVRVRIQKKISLHFLAESSGSSISWKYVFLQVWVGPTKDKKTQLFVTLNLSVILVMVKGILLH